MQNYDVAIKATNTAVNSQGSALQENARYLESANAKVNKLKVAWEELSLSAGNTVFLDMITTVTNDLRYLVNAMNALITLDPSKGNIAGGFTVLAGIVGGFTTLMNGSIRNTVFEGKMGEAIQDKISGLTLAYQEATKKVNQNRLAMNNAIPIGNQSITMMDKLKGSAVAAGGGFKVAGAAVAGFAKTASVAIATSLGIGVAIAGVSMAVGYLFTKFNEYRAKAAEEKQRQKEELKLYTDNAVAVDELSERYEMLKNKTNKSVEETQLMYDTAKQLGSYLPDLVSHVDELGRTHLVNAVSTQEYVKTLKEAVQVKAYEEYEKTTEALKKNNSAIRESIGDYEKLSKAREDAKKTTEKPFAQSSTPGYGALQPSSASTVSTYAPAAQAITEKQIQQTQENTTKSQIFNERELTARMKERNQLLRESGAYYAQMSDSYADMSAKEQEMFSSTLDRSVSVLLQQSSKKSEEIIKNLKEEGSESTIQKLGELSKQTEKDVEELTDKLLNMFKVVSTLPSFDKVLFEGMASNGQSSAYREILDDYASALDEIDKKQTQILTKNNVQTSDGLTGQALTEYQALVSMKSQVASVGQEIIDSAFREGVALSDSTVEVFRQNVSLDENRKAAIEAVSSMSDLEEVNSEVAGAVSEATSAIDDLGSALGYADGELKRTMSTVGAYNDILSKNADGYTYTVDEMVNLIDKNPDLIRAFNVQNGAVSLNTSVVEELREAQRQQFLEKIKQTQDAMLQDALGAEMFARYSGDKVNSIKTVAEAEKELVRVKQAAAMEIAKIEGAMASIDKDDPNYGRQMYAGDLAARMQAQIEADTQHIQAALDNINQLEENAKKIGAAIVTPTRDLYNANKAAAESNKKVTETEKNKQDSISKSTYLTNKYTEAIDKATAAVEKQTKLKNKYAQGSKAYAKALLLEIKALEKQKKATKEYMDVLANANRKKQIIANTGIHTSTTSVTTDNKGNIISTGGTQKGYDIVAGAQPKAPITGGSPTFQKTGAKKLSGWNGINSAYGIYRTIGGKTWKHEGIDVKGRNGERLDSNVNGTVIHTGGRNPSLGIPSEYGNTVVIKDTRGIFHIYAHLSKISVRNGQKVGVGEQIGLVGNTGNSYGAHLHYEQRSAMGRWGQNLLNPTQSTKNAINNKQNTYTFSSGGGMQVSSMSAAPKSSSAKLVGGGVLKGKESLFDKYGKQYGVDPALALAIAMHETGNGSSNGVRNYNNPGGMMSPSSNWEKQTVFKSLDAGIEAMISNLSRNYIKQGLTSIEAIQKKYAPVGASNDESTNLNGYWVSGVTSQYKKMTGGQAPNTASSPIPANDTEKAKAKAEQSKQQAERQQALAAQTKEEEAQRKALLELEEQRQDLILGALNARADIYNRMYTNYQKDADSLRSDLEHTVVQSRASVSIHENLIKNAALQRRSVQLEIQQMTKDRKSDLYKQLSNNRKNEFDERFRDLRRLLKQEKWEEIAAKTELEQEKALIREKLYDRQMKSDRKRSALYARQLAVIDGESNKDLVKKYVILTNQEAAERRIWDIKKRQLNQEKKILESIKRRYGSTSQAYATQMELVKKYGDELLGIEDTVNSINSAQRDMAKSMTEDIIEKIRDAMEKQREAELKSIDDIEKKRMRVIQHERNARKNSHEKLMKEMDEERKKMNEYFDERLKQLDKQEDERSHGKQMDEFGKREQDIRKQLNRISLDDSYEAKAKRKELMEQLKQLEEEREEYLYQRNLSKQKEAINEERETYEKSMDEKQKKEEDAFEDFNELLDKREEAEKALFEKMRENLNKYYDDALNDEAKWNRIREEAMKGNFASVKKMAENMLVDTSTGFRKMLENMDKTFENVLKDLSYIYDDASFKTIELSDSVKKSFEDIVHTSKNSFDSLGRIIQANYIDKLKEALDLMAKLKGKDFDFESKNPNGSDDMSNEDVFSGLTMYAKQSASAKAVIVRSDANGTSKAVGSLVDGKGYSILEQGANYSKVSLGGGKTGWVKNSELVATKDSNTWGAAGSNTMAAKLKTVNDPIEKLLSQYSSSSSNHNWRLDNISYDSGKRVYQEMVTESTARIKEKYQKAFNTYSSAYEKATTNADRTKAVEEYIKALSGMQNEVDRAKREFDALFESLKGATTIEKTATMSNSGALYANAYASSDGIMTSIPKGTKIKVLRDRGLMYEVQYGDKTGFVDKKNVGSFASGGWYTGNFEGGMPAVLHKKELVLNKEQTQNMLKTVEFTDRMVAPLRALVSKMQSVKTGGSQPSIHIENINNDFSNNEIKDGKDASKEMVKELTNMLNTQFNKRL